jgi:hypothetical protein
MVAAGPVGHPRAVSAADGLFIAGTIPFALLGAVHLALTLRDVRRPTFFAPTDEGVVRTLEATGVAGMAPVPGAQSMWRAWLGANLTHAVGLLAFGALQLVVAAHDAALVSEVPGLRALGIAVALAYTLIALRFWFPPAAIATSAGLACFLAAAISC